MVLALLHKTSQTGTEQNMNPEIHFPATTCCVTITVYTSVTVKVLKKARKHYTLGVLYYAMATAQSCKHFPLPSLLSASRDLSEVNVVSAFCPI